MHARRSPSRVPLLALVAAAAAAVFPPGSVAEVSPDARAALDREAAVLRTELDLAREGGFYLRLDARRRQLSLMLEGVPLEDYPLDALETAAPRILFCPRLPPPGWDQQGWAGGRLDPERARDRTEVTAPAPSPAGDAAAAEPAPPPIPPTAEESYSVPARYRIVFAGGQTLEVTAEGGGRNRGILQRLEDALALRAGDFLSAMEASGTGRARIRVRMSAEDAASLYRSLPPEVGLVVAGLAPR